MSEPTPTRGEQATTGLQSGPQPAPSPLVERLENLAEAYLGNGYEEDYATIHEAMTRIEQLEAEIRRRDVEDVLADSDPLGDQVR